MTVGRKTSQESLATFLDGTELVRGVQAGGNVKLTTGSIAGLALTSLGVVGNELTGVNFYHDDSAQFADRGAVITTNRDLVSPLGIAPSQWHLATGNGDNTTFRGVSCGYMKSRDRPGITSAQRGVLYGLQLSIEPHYSRNNYPYDDADCLILSNEGDGQGTEAIYAGRKLRDIRFTGYITAGILTVVSMIAGRIVTAIVLTGPGISGDPVIVSGPDAGGVGDYGISIGLTAGSAGSPITITAVARDFGAVLGVDMSAETVIYTTADYNYGWNSMLAGRSNFRKAMFLAPDNTNIIMARNSGGTDSPILQWLNDRVSIDGREIRGWANWTPTITADSGTFTTLTINGSETRWQKVNGLVFARVTFQVVTVGSAAGSFRITPPSTPANTVDGRGADATGARALVGNWLGSTMRLTRDGGADPIVAGNTYTAVLTYEAA